MNMDSLSLGLNRDPLRRFTPTHLTACLPIMGRTIRLETNSRAVLNRTQQLFEPYDNSTGESPDFIWRIVTETSARAGHPWPGIAAFSEEGLRFVSFGQSSFFAVDFHTLIAVGFLPESFANDQAGFVSAFLSTLFHMTAAALRLTPVAAACVSLEKEGLLIFGPLMSGKTVSTYMAGQEGLTFHSDQATFLELKADALRAWGQFWPSAFRPDAQTLLPELLPSFRTFTCADLTFLCLEENPFQPPKAYSVAPVSCVFLERRVGEPPTLRRLQSSDFVERLKSALPIEEDKRFEVRNHAVLGALARLPAYQLVFGDSRAAANVYRRLLTSHDRMEAAV
jgi:hypothetical protein